MFAIKSTDDITIVMSSEAASSINIANFVTARKFILNSHF